MSKKVIGKSEYGWCQCGEHAKVVGGVAHPDRWQRHTQRYDVHTDPHHRCPKCDFYYWTCTQRKKELV